MELKDVDLTAPSDEQLAELRTRLIAEIDRRRALEEIDVLPTLQQAAADLVVVLGTPEFAAEVDSVSQDVARQLFSALRLPKDALLAVHTAPQWMQLQEKLRAIAGDGPV